MDPAFAPSGVGLEQSRNARIDHAIREFIEEYCSEPWLAFTKIVVTQYRIFLEHVHYRSSTVSLEFAAVHRLAYEALMSDCSVPDLTAGQARAPRS
jgi:hypothetical protein